MMARVTEIHQILFLSPDFRFSRNVGIPAEIIQSKIGSRAELRKKRVVGWEVGGRRGDSTGLDNNFGSIAPSRFAKAPEFWLLALTLTETRLCVIYSPMNISYK